MNMRYRVSIEEQTESAGPGITIYFDVVENVDIRVLKTAIQTAVNGVPKARGRKRKEDKTNVNIP